MIAPELQIPSSKCTSSLVSLFAVFDGHGGSQCSAFCAQHLVETVSKALSDYEDCVEALRAAIFDLNKRAIKSTTDKSGSTACVVMIDHATRDLWCCNVGDSRCLLINDNCSRVQQLSEDHHPEKPSERKRIESGGGWIKYGKVCGILSVSRAIGMPSHILVPDNYCTSMHR